MICGIGTDIVEIPRISGMVRRLGDTFLERAFTAAERREAALRKDPSGYYSGRWAAKEAAAKALGCGIGAGCSLTDIEILDDPAGKPVMTLSGNAAETLTSQGGKTLFVSISHEKDYATGFVVIEK